MIVPKMSLGKNIKTLCVEFQDLLQGGVGDILLHKEVTMSKIRKQDHAC